MNPTINSGTRSGLAASPASHDRSYLEGMVDAYLAALYARDPSRLPLRDEVKFTENGQRLEPGDGLWNTADGPGSYSLVIADPQAGQVGCFCTIRENGAPAILALRLKVKAGGISEIETIVSREDASALRLEKLDGPHPVYLEAVPPSERASREALIDTANLYFEGLQQNDGKGYYPFTDDCNRLENGMQTTNRPADEPRGYDISALSCKAQFESGFFRFVTRIRDRRFLVIDEERGLVFVFVFFDHAGNTPTVTLTNGITVPIAVSRPWTWEIAELFKIERGLLRQIEAVARECPYGMSSGWSSWEEGLSTRIR